MIFGELILLCQGLLMSLHRFTYNFSNEKKRNLLSVMMTLLMAAFMSISFTACWQEDGSANRRRMALCS
jgi:hypothetical protein